MNVTWKLDPHTGKMTISGVGPMEDYEEAWLIPWYSGRKYIRTLVIEEGVTEIGDLAFQGCEELETLRMAESVKILGVKSFKGCKKIRRLALPNKLEVISPRAFQDCTGLEYVYIPKSVKSIEGSTFVRRERRRTVTVTQKSSIPYVKL